MPAIVVVIIVLLCAAMALFVVREHNSNKRLRENILQNGQRLDGAAYLAAMPFPVLEETAGLALRLRAVFGEIGRLPVECVLPGMALDDAFRAACSMLYDGIDLAELVMEIEDCLDVEIPEDSVGPHIDEDDTVATCTKKLIEYALKQWPERLRLYQSSR